MKNKFGNVNSATMLTKSVSMKRRNHRTRQSTTSLKQLLKLRIRRSWVRKISLSFSWWTSLGRCASHNLFRVSTSSRVIKLKRWKIWWSLAMVQISSCKVNRMLPMSAGCSAFKLQSINKSKTLEMVLPIEKLVLSLSMTKWQLLEMELKIQIWSVVTSLWITISWWRMALSKEPKEWQRQSKNLKSPLPINSCHWRRRVLLL